MRNPKRRLSSWCKDAKKAMIDKDMTIKELASEANISFVYASKITSGVIVPSHETLTKICEILEIDCPEADKDLISLQL